LTWGIFKISFGQFCLKENQKSNCKMQKCGSPSGIVHCSLVFLATEDTEVTEINALRTCWDTYSVAAYSLSRCKHLRRLLGFNRFSFGAFRKADEGGRWLLTTESKRKSKCRNDI